MAKIKKLDLTPLAEEFVRLGEKVDLTKREEARFSELCRLNRALQQRLSMYTAIGTSECFLAVADSSMSKMTKQQVSGITGGCDAKSWPLKCMNWEAAETEMKKAWRSFEWKGTTWWLPKK